MTPKRAKELLKAMVEEFPGFVNATEVNGADLVEWLARELDEATIQAYEDEGMSRSDAQGLVDMNGVRI